MKAFLMKLLKDKAVEKASESLTQNGQSLSSPLLKYAAIGGGGLFLSFILFIIIIFMVMAPILLAEEYVNTFTTGVSNFFERAGNFIKFKGWCTDEECEETFEDKFYKELDEVYQDYQDDGVDLNVNLITATIYYDSTIGREEDDDMISDIEDLASHMVSHKALDYDKYREYLLDTYIPDRYSHLYNDDIGKEKIANDIMSYADYSKNNLVDKAFSSGCSQITLKEANGDINILPLEDYVAGVATAENGGANDEALKLQAIAARSFAVKNCNRIIVNSINGPVDGKNDQAYKKPSERAIVATEATKGKILTYNGDIFEISFASYPKANYRDPNGFPGYYEQGYLCRDVDCSIGSDGRNWCSTVLYKQPNMETFELKMPEVNESGDYWNRLPLTKQGGHCYGISQVASMYYEEELGYTYDKMIAEFLSPGVSLVDMSTVARGLVAGGKYSSNAPLYNTGSEFFSNINYEYYATVAQAGASSSGYSYYGECPWYAKGRAIELIANSNMPDELKIKLMNSVRSTRGDGGQWFNNMDGNLFEKSTDLYAARPGALVSWSQGNRAGHVAIVEDVKYDDNGKVTQILMSEGWNGTGSPSGATYSMKWWNVEQFRHYYGSHNFIGYVYLLG